MLKSLSGHVLQWFTHVCDADECHAMKALIVCDSDDYKTMRAVTLCVIQMIITPWGLWHCVWFRWLSHCHEGSDIVCDSDECHTMKAMTLCVIQMIITPWGLWHCVWFRWL